MFQGGVEDPGGPAQVDHIDREQLRAGRVDAGSAVPAGQPEQPARVLPDRGPVRAGLGDQRVDVAKGIAGNMFGVVRAVGHRRPGRPAGGS